MRITCSQLNNFGQFNKKKLKKNEKNAAATLFIFTHTPKRAQTHTQTQAHTHAHAQAQSHRQVTLLGANGSSSSRHMQASPTHTHIYSQPATRRAQRKNAHSCRLQRRQRQRRDVDCGAIQWARQQEGCSRAVAQFCGFSLACYMCMSRGSACVWEAYFCLPLCVWKCARCLAREILFSMTCCTRAPWQFYSSLSARICNNVPRKIQQK